MNEPFQLQVAQLRRSQILKAALVVFAERGFHRTTIRDIAKAAGVADGTIYNYFENKQALLFAILSSINESDRRDIDFAPMLTADVRQFFRAYFAHRLAIFDGDNQRILRVLLSEVLTNTELRERYVQQVIEPTFTLAERYFAQLADAGRLKPIDVPLLVRSLAATTLGLLLLRLLGDRSLNERWNDIPDVLTAIMFDGIAPHEGTQP